MTKTSNVSSLSELLKLKTEQDQAENRALILTEQEKLLTGLNRSYSEGLNTTLERIQESLKSRLGQMALLTASEAQTLEKMVQDLQTKHSKEIETFYERSKAQIFKQVTPAKSELRGMAKMLKELSGSMESLNAQTQANIRSTRKTRLWSLIIGLSVFLSICAGSWGLIQYLSSRIQLQLATIESQQTTLDAIVHQTLGIDLHQDKTGRYVVLPADSEPKIGWKIGERQAVKF